MDNFQVKVTQVKEPPGLASVQFLGLAEVCQVLVIGEYLYQEGETMKVVLPGLQGLDDSKEFPIIDVIVSFCRNE